MGGDELVEYLCAVADNVAEYEGGDLACLLPAPKRGAGHAKPFSGLRFGDKNNGHADNPLVAFGRVIRIGVLVSQLQECPGTWGEPKSLVWN